MSLEGELCMRRRERNMAAYPTARGEGLIVERLPDEVVVYDEVRDRLHCLEPVAAEIWRACDGRRSLAEVARRTAARLHVELDAPLVSLTLQRLFRARLLEGPPVSPPPDLVRRDCLKRAALLGGLAVVSLVAPTPAAAASCRALGQPCTHSSQCCPNNSGNRCCKHGSCGQGGGGSCAP
jgi:Coenzyme PQQ synthesis protein D (PqqD)